MPNTHTGAADVAHVWTMQQTFKETKDTVHTITGGASVTCAGGVYSAASKGGSAVVAATQSWVSLAADVLVNATMAAITAVLSAGTMYLSLTTGSTAAVTADVFVFGVILD